MNKQTLHIQGMHCRSCEILIEEKLKEIPEISKANVNHRNGTAEISYGSQKPNAREVEHAIREAGYVLGINNRRQPFFSRNMNDYRDLGIATLFLCGIAILFHTLNVESLSIFSLEPSVPVAILVGLAAGFSSCMALVGGLILGIAARHAEEHPDASTLQKFRPHIFFNLGRIISYAVLGTMLGAIGSVLQFSSTTIGILTLVIALVMIIMGIKLIGIVPGLEHLSITLPKGLSKTLGLNHRSREYSHRNAFIAGTLTFFLPCGFTQSMQIFAVASGSPFLGGAAMGLFAIGTAVGLLGLGGLTSSVKGIFAKRFFAFSGLTVLLFAFVNITNGATLLGWTSISQEKNADINTRTSESLNQSSSSKASGNIQIIRMHEYAGGYRPQTLTVQAGTPVRWIITAETQYSCAASLVVPKLGIQKYLQKGENIIEFTPTEAGIIPFSCSMGMYTGKIIVTEGATPTTMSTSPDEISENTSSAGICTNSGCNAPVQNK